MPRPRRRRTKEERETEQFVDHMMYLLTAPWITWPQQESIYDHNENRSLGKLARLAHSKEIFENQECTEFEAMLYISTSTLEHPPGHDLYVVYGWLFKRYKPEQGAEIFPEGYDIPPDLNTQQEELLSKVRRWIYRTQMNHLKKQLDADQPAVDVEGQELREEQQKLF